MADRSLWPDLNALGIEIDHRSFLNATGDRIANTRKGAFDEWRQTASLALAPGGARPVGAKDAPSGFSAKTLENALSDFTDRDREDIHKRSLFLEVTPATLYWSETGDKLIEPIDRSVGGASRGESLKQAYSPSELLMRHLHDRRAQRSDLRGDVESLQAFGNLLFDPKRSLPRDLKAELLAHFIAHSHIQSRAKEAFRDVERALGPAAEPTCEIIRRIDMEPEVMNHALYLNTLGPGQHALSAQYAQEDFLPILRMGISENATLDGREKAVAKAQVNGLGKLLRQEREADNDGLISDAAATRMFELSRYSEGSAISLIPHEMSRRERLHTRAIETRMTRRDMVIE